MTRFHENKEKNGVEMSNAEKMEIAVKREKLRKARKIVNASLDGSFGKLKKRRIFSTKTHSQSFVMRQASAVELKNRALAVELAKTRQFCSQLERVNYCLKEKHMIYAMKLTSLQNKLQKTLDANRELEKQNAVKDNLLSDLQNQLSVLLRGITKVQTECGGNRVTDRDASFKPQRILPQTLDEPSSDEESVEEEKGSDIFQRETAQNCKVFRHDMSVLKEDGPGSAEEDFSGYDSDEEFAGEDSRESQRNEEKDLPNEFEQTNADLNLQVSFSSVASSCESDENKTSHTIVSMELTAASNREEESKEQTCEQPADTLSNSPTLKASKSAENNDDTTRTPREKNRSSTKPRRVSRKANTCKPARMKVMQERALGDKNQTIFDFLSASSDSFVSDPDKKVKLNCSKSFSPVSQKPDCDAHWASVPGSNRASAPGSIENEDLSTRRSSRRRAGPTSYAEPSLNSKLRRGDKISDGSMQSSFSPKKKKVAGKKRNLVKNVGEESQESEND